MSILEETIKNIDTPENADQFIDTFSDKPNEINGLLIRYTDDSINDCLKEALKRKTRVRYRCFDVFGNYLAFGTSSGAIYLFKLEPGTHSRCSLVSVTPHHQGSIEVLRFLSCQATHDLLIAIGTSRGSLMIFKLTHLHNEEKPTCTEIYKAESFTGNNEVKLIEPDFDLLDSLSPIYKLYICDSANRIYVLDSLQSGQQKLRTFFCTSNGPPLILHVKDSQINQISVCRSSMLISTTKTTLMFDEHCNSLEPIGIKKRPEGFYGACFFTASYKPPRVIRPYRTASQSRFPSTASMDNLEQLIQVFVARPSFSFWKVNYRERSVELTQKPMISSAPMPKVLDIQQEPINEEEEDDFGGLKEIVFNAKSPLDGHCPKSTHFERLIPIYCSTLGNLLLSYTRRDLFIIDPVGVRLIAWHSQDDNIVQVCCNENELFVLSSSKSSSDFLNHKRKTSSMGLGSKLHQELSANLYMTRFVLMAPTQFVLELHRLNRFISLIGFVEHFVELFKNKMAIPITGQNIITTEGGLLRNVLLSVWHVYAGTYDDESTSNERLDRLASHEKFRLLIKEIVAEGREMRGMGSLENNLSSSRFFISMANENLARLKCEPYASFVSLDISIADLHTKHVIHFSKEDLNTSRRSLANLTTTRNLNGNDSSPSLDGEEQQHYNKKQKGEAVSQRLDSESDDHVLRKIDGSEPKLTNHVIVERQTTSTLGRSVNCNENVQIDSILSGNILTDDESADIKQLNCCANCKLPISKAHLVPLSSSQEIQRKWIEETLLSGIDTFESDAILEKAFNFQLWEIYLKSLARRNQVDDYINCCMMLDDVRLIEFDLLLQKIGENVELEKKMLDLLIEKLIQKSECRQKTCLNCGKSIETTLSNINDGNDNEISGNYVNNCEEFSFNLVNVFEKLLFTKSSIARQVVGCLLEQKQLLDDCRIPASFFLRIIAAATLTANQSSLSWTRLGQLKAAHTVL